MPKKNNRKNRGSRSNASNGDFQSRINRQIASSRNPTLVFPVTLCAESTLTSTAGGVLAGVFTMDPSSCAKWSSYAAIFDGFRVVGGRLKIASIPANGSAVLSSIVRFAFDNDSAGTPTAYNDVISYSEIRDVPAVWSGGAIKVVPFKRPKQGHGEYLWLDEQTPSGSLGGLKYYGSGLTVSTNYWHVIIEYLVQFTQRS